MSFADSVSGDYMVAAHDLPGSGTFTAIRSGGSTNYSLTGIGQQAITVREQASSGGYYRVGDRRFELPNVQITDAAHKPQPGDTLLIDGVTWRLLDATLDEFGIAWVCVARKSR